MWSRAIVLEQLRRLLGLGVGHAGDRLVDQQQLRVLRQQHADLQPLLLAVARGSPASRSRSAVEADDVEDLVDAPALVGGVRAEQQRRAGAAVGLQRQLEVVVDRVALEHGRLLELAADAELGDLGLVEPGEVDACRRT